MGCLSHTEAEMWVLRYCERWKWQMQAGVLKTGSPWIVSCTSTEHEWHSCRKHSYYVWLHKSIWINNCTFYRTHNLNQSRHIYIFLIQWDLLFSKKVNPWIEMSHTHTQMGSYLHTFNYRLSPSKCKSVAHLFPTGTLHTHSYFSLHVQLSLIWTKHTQLHTRSLVLLSLWGHSLS